MIESTIERLGLLAYGLWRIVGLVGHGFAAVFLHCHSCIDYVALLLRRGGAVQDSSLMSRLF
jgi:hypothetical protein